MKNKWLIVVLCLISSVAFAQKKIYAKSNYWLTAQSQYMLRDSSSFFYEGNVRISSDDDLSILDGRPFFWRHHMFGYEQRLGKFSLGGSIRFQKSFRNQINFYRIYLAHTTYWKGLSFRNQLQLERLDMKLDRLEDQNRIGINSRLVRNFSLWQRWYSVYFSFEAYQVNYLEDGTTKIIDIYSKSADNQRRINITRSRVGVAHWISSKLIVSVFAMRETDYFFSLAKYDMNQQQIEPQKRLNRITPTYGLTVGYRINGRSITYDHNLIIF